MGRGSEYSCWERLCSQGAIWRKSSLRALPADAICQRASISLQVGQCAVPPGTRSSHHSSLFPRRSHSRQPEHGESLGHIRFVLGSAPAISTAEGTMKVTAYDFDCSLQKCVYGLSLRFIKHKVGRKGVEEGPPWSVSTQML